jgi:hypothetical protein
MADISAIAPVARRSTSPRPKATNPGLGASLAAVCGLLADAFRMAYVAPYACSGRAPGYTPDDNLEGRDPEW